MKNKQIKLNKDDIGCLYEAYRRNYYKLYNIATKEITERWLGLGTYSDYKSVIDKGLMKFYDGKRPPKRCCGWLVLTQLGASVLADNKEMFEKKRKYEEGA